MASDAVKEDMPHRPKGCGFCPIVVSRSGKKGKSALCSLRLVYCCQELFIKVYTAVVNVT